MERWKLMKNKYKVATALAVAGLILGNLTAANAATKTITCYKGSTKKLVTGTKCPAGYTTTAPKASAPATAKGGSVVINATYSGTINMLWAAGNKVTVTGLSAKGSGTTAGLDALSATGNADASAVSSDNTCTSNIDATGTFGTGADTLKVKFGAGVEMCASGASEDPPFNIQVKSSPLVIVSGTGKFAGATSKDLTLSGSFVVNTYTKNAKDSSAVTLKLTGTVTTK
jgi:hypothetical protein